MSAVSPRGTPSDGTQSMRSRSRCIVDEPLTRDYDHCQPADHNRNSAGIGLGQAPGSQEAEVLTAYSPLPDTFAITEHLVGLGTASSGDLCPWDDESLWPNLDRTTLEIAARTFRKYLRP